MISRSQLVVVISAGSGFGPVVHAEFALKELSFVQDRADSQRTFDTYLLGVGVGAPLAQVFLVLPLGKFALSVQKVLHMEVVH